MEDLYLFVPPLTLLCCHSNKWTHILLLFIFYNYILNKRKLFLEAVSMMKCIYKSWCGGSVLSQGAKVPPVMQASHEHKLELQLLHF